MNQEHYTIEQYSELFTEKLKAEQEEKMLEHVDGCPLCKVKMRAATLFTLLEDDKVLQMVMQQLMDKNKDSNADSNADEDEDEDLD